MKIQIFKALDHLFCKPDNPSWSDIVRDGEVVGYNLDNIIQICKQHQFVTAINDPDRGDILLVFGKYPVKYFLLKPIGCISNICYSEN